MYRINGDNTIECWEVKKSTLSKSQAVKQLDGYIRSDFYRKEDLKLNTAEKIVGGELIERSFAVGEYNVRYWNGGDGIIFYDIVDPQRNNERLGSRSKSAIRNMAINDVSRPNYSSADMLPALGITVLGITGGVALMAALAPAAAVTSATSAIILQFPTIIETLDKVA